MEKEIEKDLQRFKAHSKAFIAELLVGIGGIGLLVLGSMMLILSLVEQEIYAHLAISQIITYLAMIHLGLIGLGVALFIEWLIDERMKSPSSSSY